MTSVIATEAIDAYRAAVSQPGEETRASLAPHLADDVKVVGPVGAAAGKEQVLTALGALPTPALLANAEWEAPKTEGDTVVVRASLPGGMPLRGMEFHITLTAAGRIGHVAQVMMPGAPPPTTDLDLEPMKAAIDGALANRTPVIVAYVDERGAPRLSPRGTAQVFSRTQMALWARDSAGGLPRSVAARPWVTFFYRDPATRTTYQLSGRARITSDPAERDTIFENSPQVEQNADALRRGVAIVVDIESAEGGGPGGRVRMVRGG